MGSTSKPLIIAIDEGIATAHAALFAQLAAQGHTIRVLSQAEAPDLLLAPYAFRLTADMLSQMPTQGFTVLLRGARELRYAPLSPTTTQWRSPKKHAQTKKTATRSGATKKAQAAEGGMLPLEDPAPAAGAGKDPGGQPADVAHLG